MSSVPDRRQRIRKQLGLMIPVRLVDDETQAGIFCQIYDVNRAGLGVITQQMLPIGKIVKLVTLNGDVKFQVVWCEEPKTAEVSFNCGLDLVDGQHDLEKMFDRFFK